MNPSNQRLPCVSIFFLLWIGISASAAAFWLIDHRLAVPNSGIVIVVLVGVFFVSCTWALFRYLRWRDQRRAIVPVSGPVQPDPNLEGTIYGMIPDREYQVMKSFTDHYGNAFEQGERLRFKQRHFLPYHGGHTVVFEGKSLYLQEDQNREILDHFSEYIALSK
jgi:hypothetical protein